MSLVAVAIRSRAITTFSNSPALIRITASHTAPSQSAALREPSAKATLAGAGGSSCCINSGRCINSGEVPVSGPIKVSQV